MFVFRCVVMKYVLCIFPCFCGLFCNCMNPSDRVRQISWEEACQMDFDVKLSENELREYYPRRYWQGIVEDNANALLREEKNDSFDNLIKCLVLCSIDLLLNKECDESVAYDIITRFLMDACTSRLNHRQLSSDILEHVTSSGISSVIDEERLLKAFLHRVDDRYNFNLISSDSNAIKCLVERSIFCCFGILFTGYTLFTENYFDSKCCYQKIMDISPYLSDAMSAIVTGK